MWKCADVEGKNKGEGEKGKRRKEEKSVHTQHHHLPQGKLCYRCCTARPHRRRCIAGSHCTSPPLPLPPPPLPSPPPASELLL